MTGSVNATAPVLVLGLGNLLLTDDGVGLRLLETLEEECGFGHEAAEFMDGGTQGLALLPYLADRSTVLVLDAIGLGGNPGTIHVLRGPQIAELRARRASTAHEGNCLEILEIARMLGYDFEDIAVVGVEPSVVRTGIGLSPEVEAAVDEAVAQARTILSGMVEHVSCNTR
ncbi:MAG: hydrogenase maturation protease [Bryobacteraceae bacterium]